MNLRGNRVTLKTIIVFETHYGSTKQAASRIAKILKKDFSHEVFLYNLSKNQKHPDISSFDNVIVGSCIYNGSWVPHIENFLANSFDEKKIALFVCSMFAGEKSLYKHAYRTYLENLLEKYPHIKPISMEAFGGRVPKYNYPDEWVTQVANKLPSFTTDNKDLAKIDDWGRKLGNLLKQD